MGRLNDILIEADGLGRRFARCEALSQVSFSVTRGELVALLGPNGSGKTTALRLLAGVIPPTEGYARLGGLDVTLHSLAVRRRMGYLPEATPLYSEMRVEEYLVYRGRVRGLKGAHLMLRLHEVVEHCGLGTWAKRPIGVLSHGLRRRVALADCLLHSPDVLLLDEPLDGLDAAQAAMLRGLLVDLSADCAIVFSTHALAEVETLCQRVLILSGGRLVADGDPKGLIAAQSGAQTFEQAFIRMTAQAETMRNMAGVTPRRRKGP